MVIVVEQTVGGGHNDRINGGYHYHHGMHAHQHPNGIYVHIETKMIAIVIQFGTY